MPKDPAPSPRNTTCDEEFQQRFDTGLQGKVRGHSGTSGRTGALSFLAESQNIHNFAGLSRQVNGSQATVWLSEDRQVCGNSEILVARPNQS